MGRNRRGRRAIDMAMLAMAGAYALPAAFADARAAGPDGPVMSVLAPGQGENIADGTAAPSATFSAQLAKYRDLPRAIDRLTDSMLPQFYKAMDFAPVPAADVARIDRPRPGVTIVRDKTYGIPRIEGRTRADAMFGIGYAQAQSLLWQMEVNRSSWYAATASLLGPGSNDENLKNDALLFRVLDYSPAEYRLMYRRLGTAHGRWGRQAQADIAAYVAGINAYIDTAGSSGRLPAEFGARGLTPARWKPEDVVAATAWSHVRGLWRALGPREAGNAILLRQLQARFGEKTGAQVYADLRDDGDPETPRIVPGTDRAPPAPPAPGSAALIDPGSLAPRDTLVASSATVAGKPMAFVSEPPSKSNALLVAAPLSASGHPISVQGPQDGYGYPHNYDFEIQVTAPDLAARGSLEFHGPYPYNGARGRDFAFSGTAQYIDQFDMFAEPLCTPGGGKADPASAHHRYRGRCIPFVTRNVTRSLPGGGSYTLRSTRSVHGPVIGRATVDGAPVALAQARSTFLDEASGLAALAQVFMPSRVHSAARFVQVMAAMPRQLAFYYIDRSDIAVINPGAVPIRAAGMRPDLPAWGDGRWDWQGFDPAHYRFRKVAPADLPRAINPPDHVIAGWNNIAGDPWPMADGQWIAGPGHRVSLLKDPTLKLAAERPLTRTDLVAIHTRAAITDVRAHAALALLRRIVGDDIADGEVRGVLASLDAWSRDGTLRREGAEAGMLEHGAAIAVWDRWWPLLLRGAFQRALGHEIMDQAGGNPNNLSALNTGPGSVSGWIGTLSKDLRSVLGEAVPGRFSRIYCGDGDRGTCRADIVESLKAAIAATRAEVGPDFATRRYPIVCDTCTRTVFDETGAAGRLAPIPWQNRPTFELVIGFR